jgi:autotransporter-associated beta strand protein
MLMVVVFLLEVVVPSMASAAPSTWTGSGGSGLWGTSSNWGSTPRPTTSGTYQLVFGGSTQLSGTNDVGNVTVDAIDFRNTATSLFILASPAGNPLTLASATITTSATTGSLNATGDTISMPVILSGSSIFRIGAGHAITVSGTVSGTGSLSLTATSGSTSSTRVNLTGPNSYSGGTYVFGGILTNGSSTGTSFSNTGFGTGDVTVSGSGSLFVRNGSTIANNLTLSGNGFSQSGVEQGALRGSFGSGTSTATISGTVTLAGHAQIATASTVTGDAGSQLVLANTVNLGSSTLTLKPGQNASAASGLPIVISGSVGGAGGIVVSGSQAATVRMSGANSYSGGTTISSGTLALSGAGSIGTGGLNLGTTASPGVFDLAALTAGTYSLPSTASLAGVGTLAGSGKSLAVFGSFLPGNSPGTVTVSSGFALDLTNSGSSVFEITDPTFTAGTYDLVSGSGSVAFGGILNLAFSGGSYADGTDVLQLFANTGGWSGNFTAVHATGLAAGQSATFNPATGFITVVPEPSAVVMGLTGLACGCSLCWRRRGFVARK